MGGVAADRGGGLSHRQQEVLGVLGRVGAQAAGQGVVALNALDVGARHRGLTHSGVDPALRVGDRDHETVGNGEHLTGEVVGPGQTVEGVLHPVDFRSRVEQSQAQFTPAFQQ